MGAVRGGRRDAGAEARLLDGVTALVARDGFASLTVDGLLAFTGIARTTFYQHFRGVDDCFAVAYRRHARALVDEVAAAADRNTARGTAALAALGAAARVRPDGMRMLVVEGLAAGPAGRRDHDELVAALAAALPRAEDTGEPLPAEFIVGGVLRFLAMQPGGDLASLGLDRIIADWTGAFRRMGREGFVFLPALPPPVAASERLAAIEPAGPSRDRITHATAVAVALRGFRSVRVADIADAAGVSRRFFYRHFPHKAAAFQAFYEAGFESAVAACAPAFFGPGGWGERVWRSGVAFTRFLAREPLVAQAGFVDCYAPGGRFREWVHECVLAFTLFLEDGERLEPRAVARADATLTTAMIMELAFLTARHWPRLTLRAVLPAAAVIALTPFVGPDEAHELVAAKVAGAV